MVARFDVQRCGPSIGAGVCAAALMLAAAGCPGNTLLVGEERPLADRGADDVDGLGSIDPAVPPPEPALITECPLSPEERQAQPGCWPTRHVGSWRGFFTGTPRYATVDGGHAEFPVGDVRLEIADDGRANLTFGIPPQGSPSSDEPLLLCGPLQRAPGCPTPGLVLAGFAYELGALEFFDPEVASSQPRIVGEPPLQLGERMTFEVNTGQPWDVWCSTQEPGPEVGCTGGDCPAGEWLPAYGAAVDSPATASDHDGCSCEPNGCRAQAPSLSLSVELRMSGDGNALRGAYRPNGTSLGEARLEFRKAAR